ncbi:MAG: response regulator [Chromatiales bacterium]|nr:response regulator [Chromatiales bacterium]
MAATVGMNRQDLASVLIVDDEPFNLELLSSQLEDAGFHPVCVDRGEQAWELLQEAPERFDAVLLDRMMPGLDGIEILERIKQDSKLRGLPVVMQTAKADKESVLEGLRSGAHYYLTKPFDHSTLLAIVNSAVSDHRNYRELREQATSTVRTLGLMDHGRFRYQTLQEARDLASLLGSASPQGNRLIIGLSELLINAVEHGNLGIQYAEKSILQREGRWQEEVDRRQALPENADKFVTVEYRRSESELYIRICDQGDGFDWAPYQEISPERAFDTHGRGIAMARMLSFDNLEYIGKGNEVEAVVKLSPP